MLKVSLYLNDDGAREYMKEMVLEAVPRIGELVMVKGYGGALVVESIHHDIDESPPKISVFFQDLTVKEFDHIVVADPAWHES